MDASIAIRTNRLLVLCGRTDPGPQASGEIARLLDRSPDWESLIFRAEEEGVLPLLYWNLRARADSVPPDILETLKVRYLWNAARNAWIAAGLEPFFRAVRDSGLWVVLTKGLRLAWTVYPDPGLRPFWDIDFIVRPGDWPAVSGILASLGFEEATAAGEDRGRSGADAGWSHSPYFRRRGLILEFHFNSPGLHFPLRAESGFWEAGPALIGGAEALALVPELELCYLCLHAQQHSFRKLVWLADIAEMVSRGHPDRERVEEICGALGIHASVYHAFRLVNALWPGTVAPDVLAKLRPGVVRRSALHFFWPEKGIAARKARISWPYDMPSLFSLWERGSPALAFRTLGSIFFPPREWLARATGVSQDSVLIYYQYVRRLARPLAVAARRMWESL
jgi:hypothetical protein